MKLLKYINGLAEKMPPTTTVYIFLLTGFVFVVPGCSSRNDVYYNWGVVRADAASTAFSKLDLINTTNVGRLKTAWLYTPDDAAAGMRSGPSECNPIIINDIMYITSGQSKLYALDPATGDKIWSFDPFHGGQNFAGERGISRGVAYWQAGQDKRILFTAGHYLFAVDAITGAAIPSFGRNGSVDLNVGMRDDPDKIHVSSTSPGIIYKNLIIMGAWSNDGEQGTPGYQRAFDVRSGELVWTFHTIPLPGEEGYDTWPNDAWKHVGGANDWGGMSLDEKRGIVFLATGSPSYDYYGADRKGKNLFGNCVVALDAATGKLRWYFQTVHHDLWDYDLPAPPNLVQIKINEKKIDAVAQVSKTGFIYILNRETGEPLFPIEERKVPMSDVPGEEAWPTQPFPQKPAPMSRHYITESDLNDASASSHKYLLDTFRKLRYEGIFTPPSLTGTFTMPASTGGAEWGGAVFNPESGILYVKSNDGPEIAKLETPSTIMRQVTAKSKSIYENGRAIYNIYCAACHGSDLKGNRESPSLIGLKDRWPAEQILQQIRNGGGRMPAFKDVVRGDAMERSIIAYLFGEKSADGAANIGGGAHPDDDADENAVWKTYRNVSAYREFTDAAGLPGIKPPWGVLNAIDLSSGEYLWKIPVGNPPAFAGHTPPKGEITMSGPIVTAGGIVLLAGTSDEKLRAFDSRSGKMLWEGQLPGIGKANPCTYIAAGKQYVAISFSSSERYPSGGVIAFALEK